jgi:hypothetical protein
VGEGERLHSGARSGRRRGACWLLGVLVGAVVLKVVLVAFQMLLLEWWW